MSNFDEDINIISSDEFENEEFLGGTGDNASSNAEPSWRNNLRKNNFKIINYVTKGNYGHIFQIQENSTKSIYALKLIKKDSEDECDEGFDFQLRKEIYVLEKLGKHPFIVTYYSSFETKEDIGIIMSYVNGINMQEVMYKSENYVLSEDNVKFYLAEISLALHFLHKNGIIHRDMKLENIMVDEDGHIKLIDFGYSEYGMGFGVKTSPLLVSKYSASPEMIEKDTYTYTADWYALGIIFSEMLTNEHPFIVKSRNKTSSEKYKDMLLACLRKEFNNEVKKKLSSKAFSLLERLVEPDPELRIGSKDDENHMEISKHVFFEEIDWTLLEAKGIKPPSLSSIQQHSG